MTTLMVQTDRILYNLSLMQRFCGKSGIIPNLSANAYGLGDAALAGLLVRSGITTVAVSKLEEAERILSSVNGIDVILLTPYCSEEEAERIVSADIIATVSSNENAVLLSGVAGRMNRIARAHLRFDIGAGSTGFLPEEAKKASQTVKFLKNLNICGVYAMLRAGAGKKDVTAYYTKFTGVLQTLAREDIDYGVAHIAEDDDILRNPFVRADAVRVGRALCGRLDCKDKWGLRKVGRMVTNICDVRWIPAGHTTGENGRFRVRRAMKVATVPVGYADGLMNDQRRGTSLFGGRKAYCEVAGKRVPIIGRPGFTDTMIDVTAIDCKPGDIVSFDVSPSYVSPNVKREYV